MKIKEFCKKNKNRTTIIIVSLALVLTAAAGGGAYLFFRSGEEDSLMQNGQMGFARTSGGIRASGVTSVGVTQENFEVEDLETQLEIEEVYVSSGDEVEAGTQILKLSDVSVEEARAELEKKLREADLAYRAGSIEYEQNKITAQYEYDSAVLAGEQAQETYDETVANLEAGVEQARQALAEANEQISEYETYVNDDSYSSYFKVDEYQSLYDENLKLLTEKMAEWGIGWSQVTGGSPGGMGTQTSGNLNGNFSSATVSSGDAGGNADGSQYVRVLSSLYSVLEQNLRDLEQAKSEYEDALTNARFELQTLQLSLPSLEKAVTEAEETYETQTLQARLIYETALANSERAQSAYETALDQAETDYENLKSAWKDAKENMELFENSVGDGYFYASGAGTILQVMARAEQYLTSDGTVFVYSNPEEISVTVSVDQSDIAEISIGDTAEVTSDSGSFQGTVTQVNPVTASESRTNVTYQVTVTLSADTGQLEANKSVTVIFGGVGPSEEGRPSEDTESSTGGSAKEVSWQEPQSSEMGAE